MLSRKIISTEDGSATIFIPEWNESYHSKHGAIQEAYHVFIQNGLDLLQELSEISILEFGFGTGLNTLISFLEFSKRPLKIHYTGIEKYPVIPEEVKALNYAQALKALPTNESFSLDFIQEHYEKIMNSPWEEFHEITPGFNLKKVQADFLNWDYPLNNFDLIYFDAFGARVQPELWTEELFGKIYPSMKENAVFTTYSAKGSVRRALLSVGLNVEKRPGPPGKREMLVGFKVPQT